MRFGRLGTGHPETDPQTPEGGARNFSSCLPSSIPMLLLLAAIATPAQDQKPPSLDLTGHAILVKKIGSSEVKTPAALQHAIYEYTLGEMKKSARFRTIYREGDSAAAGARAWAGGGDFLWAPGRGKDKIKRDGASRTPAHGQPTLAPG